MHQELATVNISLPKRLRDEMERKIEREAYGSVSEYLRDLIRKDLRLQAIARVDELLLEGLHSGKARPVTEKFWRDLRAASRPAVRKRARQD